MIAWKTRPQKSHQARPQSPSPPPPQPPARSPLGVDKITPSFSSPPNSNQCPSSPTACLPSKNKFNLADASHFTDYVPNLRHEKTFHRTWRDKEKTRRFFFFRLRFCFYSSIIAIHTPASKSGARTAQLVHFVKLFGVPKNYIHMIMTGGKEST